MWSHCCGWDKDKEEIEVIANCIDGERNALYRRTGFLSASLIDAGDQ